MKIYNVIEDNDKIYIVTDDFRGADLFSYTILKNQLSEAEAASIASQMASCIKYLHKHNIVVRRLKLESIYFAEHESIHEVRLTDLSLCNYLENLQNEAPFHLEDAFKPPKSSFLGVLKFIPQYNHSMSAPELLPPINYLQDPRRYYDQKVDVWTLGCIIFNLVTGVPAYYNDDKSIQTELFAKIRAADWRNNLVAQCENATSNLFNILERCFTVDAAERIDSGEVINHPFFQVEN